ncbi:MAG: hypothetical protein ACT4QC_03455 [Planctomycetaceae bacterium]
MDAAGRSPSGLEEFLRFASWLAIATVVWGVASVAVVHAPQRVKLPLLLPMGLAALLGCGLGRMAAARQVGLRRVVFASVALLAGLGTVLTAYETYRRGVAEVRRKLAERSVDSDPLASQIERQLEEQARGDEADTDPETRRLLESVERARRIRAAEAQRQERLATFSGYLVNRIPRAWGRWPTTAAVAFWLMEVATSMVTGAWGARWGVRLAGS